MPIHAQSLDISKEFIHEPTLILRMETHLYLIKYQINMPILYPMRFLDAKQIQNMIDVCTESI